MVINLLQKYYYICVCVLFNFSLYLYTVHTVNYKQVKSFRTTSGVTQFFYVVTGVQRSDKTNETRLVRQLRNETVGDAIAQH